MAEALRKARPDVAVTVEDAVDPTLADVIDDYDASAFTDTYGYLMRWPLEKAVPQTLDTYTGMIRNGASAATARSTSSAWTGGTWPR